MSTDFFYKKFAARLCSAFFLLFMGSLCFFTVYFQSVKKVSLSLQYYYLVQEDAYTEAGALTVYNEGGASYFLENGNNEWIALAVYTKAEDAQSVLETLSNHKTNLGIVEKGVNTLYFKGIKEKALAATYVNGLKAFDGYIRALEECIYRLDNGLSQEKTKEILLKKYGRNHDEAQQCGF